MIQFDTIKFRRTSNDNRGFKFGNLDRQNKKKIEIMQNEIKSSLPLNESGA